MTDAEYTELYKSEWGKLVNYIKQKLGREYRQDAEDCAQEVFTTLWKKRDSVENPKEYIYSGANKAAAKLKELSQPYETWGTAMDMRELIDGRS